MHVDGSAAVPSPSAAWLESGQRALRRVLVSFGVRSAHHRVLDMEVHAYRLQGAGRGPAVLLVHGLGSSAAAFARSFRHFARHFGEVWAVDLPGSGLSPLPARGPLGLGQSVDVLGAFRREIIGRPVFLVGNSLGGAMSASAAAADPPGHVGLCLVAPAGAPLPKEEFEQLVSLYRLTSVREARALTRRLFHRAPLSMLAMAGAVRTMVQAPTVQHLVREVSPADALTPELLARLTMPTLVIWGKSEKLLPSRAVHHFRAHLPGSAEVQEVEGFGHMPQLEHPAALVQRIVRFATRRGLIPTAPR